VSEAGPVLYDPVELRRRIVVCFSVGELRALAESLGVGGIPWERGLQESAREVVRQCERYAGLPALVARLREARPLVEWPEPVTMGGPPGPPVAGTAGTEAAALAAPGGAPAPPAPLGFPALSASPGRLGPVEPPSSVSAPALLDPYASHAPPPPPAPPLTTGAPASVPPRAAWPGVTSMAPAPARPGGIDPRILVAVAGLMVLAAVIAYLAGRASSATAPTDAASTPAASPSSRGDGPAAHAADALARSFASLARVCELPSSAGTSALVFRRIYERCGPAAPPQRSYTPPSPTAATATAATPADPAPTEAAPPRGKRGGGRGGDPAPAEAAPTAKGCMGTCDAQHSVCRAHCGAEPNESSAYDGFQRCLGGCLKDASRCRLSCR